MFFEASIIIIKFFDPVEPLFIYLLILLTKIWTFKKNNIIVEEVKKVKLYSIR